MPEPRMFLGLTVREAQVLAAETLVPTEGEGAASDARRLLVFALGCEALELIREPGRRLGEAEAIKFAGVLERRRGGEPVSRIVGMRGFYGRDFAITPATLDPRPDSETLITAALSLTWSKWPRGAGLDILDIGTGSGCLLLTLLAELPEARGVAVDPSVDALAVARANAQRLQVADRVSWVEGRIDAVAGGLGQRFSLMISNPPYIPAGEIAGLQRDVRAFDPVLALDGGADGLHIYREIAGVLGLLMVPGWVLFEVGDGQAVDVLGIVRDALPTGQILRTEVFPDMAGKQRCVAIEIHC